MGKKGNSPDVVGAASMQGEMNRETARDVTYADRPDITNPFGQSRWGTEEVEDPATGEMVTKWTQHQTMAPDLENLYGSWMSGMQDRAGMSAGMMGRIEQEMGGAADWDQFGDVQGLDYDPTQLRASAEDAAYQKETARLDPRFEKQRESMDIRLRNQGLRPGDQSYDAQIASFGTERTDAYEQARLGATATGRTEAAQMYEQQMGSNERSNALRQQQIQEYLGQRGFSLGEMQALDPTAEIGNLADLFTG